MSISIDGGPAFPSGKSETPGFENSLPFYEGLSMRDWFAGMALSGELASLSTAESVEPTARAAALNGRSACEHIAFNCYEMADAMLAARNRGEEA